MSDSQSVVVFDEWGEQSIEYTDLLNKHGHPLRYARVTHPFPSRAERRKAGIRLPLNILLNWQALQEQALESEDVPPVVLEALGVGR